MSLTKAEFDKYNDAISKLDVSAINDLEAMLHRVWTEAGGSKDALSQIALSYAKSLSRKYGMSAAAVSAALWEDIYKNDTGARLEALIYDNADYEDSHFGDAAEAIVEKHVEEDDFDGTLSFLAGITAKAINEWAHRTQIGNTQRVYRRREKGYQNARFARIPTGDETCAWCLMLASRGFIYYSELSAGGGPWHTTEFDSFHPFCDCRIVSSFDDDPSLEGYDYMVYRAMYNHSRVLDKNGHVDMTSTLHNMRLEYGLEK